MTALALPLHAALVVAFVLLAGAIPASIPQRWRGMQRLWRKSASVPAGSSFVFTAAPAVSLAAAVLAALLVPSFTLGMPGAAAADLVVVAGLLVLSRAALALALYDALSAPAACASARAMAAWFGAGPTLLLAALVVQLLSGGTNLDAGAAAVRDGGAGAHLAGLLTGLALLGVAVAEPAMAAGSGRFRALTLLAGQARTLAALSLAALFLLPYGVAPAGAGLSAWGLGILCWAAKMTLLNAATSWVGTRPEALAPAALLVLLGIAVAAVQGAA